jgi:hypothetical protein
MCADRQGRHPRRPEVVGRVGPDPGAAGRVRPEVVVRARRNLGKTTPRETAPTWCPARPTRCRPAATAPTTEFSQRTVRADAL